MKKSLVLPAAALSLLIILPVTALDNTVSGKPAVSNGTFTADGDPMPKPPLEVDSVQVADGDPMPKPPFMA